MNFIVQKTQLKRNRYFIVIPVILVVVFILCWPVGFALSQEWATSGTNIYNTNSGNVGIGTTSPASPLHVSSNVANTNVVQFYNTNSNGYGPYFQAGGGNGEKYMLYVADYAGSGKMIVDSSGNIGIGTTNPDALLHLRKTSSITRLKIDNTGVGGQSEIYMNSNTSPWVIFTQDTYRSGNLIINTSENFTSSVLEITRTGNIGIGTTNPSAKLDVLGDATFSGTVTGGNIQAKYQDIAEWVYSPMSVASGTVVVLDVEDINRVIPSSLSYDTRVAGVVTETPGILLGEAGNGKIKVATTGRVKVKADATYRPINIGDLLVTSDKEGYAMRSEPVDLGGIPIHRPGTLIGKALEPLKEGQGEILVLLSLQ